MMSKSKGNKAEREAEDIYTTLGYETDRVGSTGGGHFMTDAFDHVDIIALHPDRRLRFAQVKSNRGSGIREFVEWAASSVPVEHVAVDFLIRHDGRPGPHTRGAAWRLQRPHMDGQDVTYRTVVDERKDGVEPEGQAVREYLRGDGE